MKPSLITIVGNIGSGKSTAMPILLEALDASPVYADDLFQSVDPFAKAYLKDTPRWAFTNELWLTCERAKLLRAHLAGQSEEAKKRHTVVDSGLLMSWIYAHSHLLVGNITLDEWEFYLSLYEHFSEDVISDMVVVRLRYSVETLLKRIRQRGRDYELEFYTAEYLEQLESGIVALEKQLRSHNVKWITIDEKDVADFENSERDRERLVEVVREGVA
jgi:deoxyadenosine/deoxycytidine kinase